MTLTTPRAAALLLAVAFGAPRATAAQVAVVSSTVQEHAALPGERYVGTIRVLNSSSQPQTVCVYQTDYAFFADGTSHFDAAGTSARSNARWVTPSAGQLVVPAGAEVPVTYVVTVPTGDTLAGTYWSTVMVEGAPVGPPNATSAPGRGQLGVGAVMRYAVQVATHVNGGSRSIGFSSLRVEPQGDGGRILELVAQNDGSRAYRPVLWMELYDDSGTLVARRQQDRGLLYPGTSLRQRFELGQLPPGTYKVVLFADTGDDAVYAVPYKLKL